MVDNTSSFSCGYQEFAPDDTPGPETERFTPTKSLSLKIGSFEVNLGPYGKCRDGHYVKLDGRPVRCRKFTVDWDAKGVAVVTLEVYP